MSVKIAFTLFMAVLVPVYWALYGPSNFLYFCDMALFLTLVGVWTESPLLISMPAVGILIPQIIWCIDFSAHLAGLHFIGMTDYMFEAERPLFLRGLSFFHGWLPFLLIYGVKKVGYDRRALPAWTILSWVLIFVCFFFMPLPGAAVKPNAPVNINYVYGLSDSVAQTWMPAWAWVATLLVLMPLLLFIPTHFFLKRLGRRPATPGATKLTTAIKAPTASSEKQDPRWQTGFWSLIVTQFQGAFSDNALKQLVLFLILGLGLPADKRDALVPAVGALFALPFILFSMAGGFLADRFSKRSVTIGVKIFEIGVMALALAGFAFHNLALQLTCVFLMGVHSAIFGPSKYGLLPEVLPGKKLSWGNGILELGTFLAVILGTMLGGILSDRFPGRQYLSGYILIGLALFGLITSFGIAKVPAADPKRTFRLNPLGDLIAQMRIIRKDRQLWLAVVGNAYFSFFAMLIMLNLVIYGKDLLHLSDAHNSYLTAALAVGIGLGSLAAGYMSHDKIEYGLIPLGAIGMTLGASALALPGLGYAGFACGLAVLGFFGGFFIVPISALLQRRPDPKTKGGILAAANLTSFVGIFAASAVYYLLALMLKPRGIFLAAALMTLAGTIYIVRLMPQAFLRLVLCLATHSVYRVKTVGRENVPSEGGALLVCNHVSFVDALLVLAAIDRPIRFMLHRDIYERAFVKPLARMMEIIPVASTQRPREMIQSLRIATQAIENGELVCIFAEGEISRIGHMLPFRRGFERIMEGVSAPIIPVCLDGVWGSIFSFSEGKFVWKIPRQIPYLVSVSFGSPMPVQSTPPAVRQSVQELLSDAWCSRKGSMHTLHQAFVQTARRHPFRFCMADSKGAPVPFHNVLSKTLFVASRLKSEWHGQKMIGILLPPSMPAALVNFAALLSGKVPVNLNYTLSVEGLESCIRQCNIEVIVTSQAFLDKLKINLPGKKLLVEEMLANPTPSEKASALFLSWFAPCRSLEKRFAGRPIASDELATVVFSSGSTGEPKGVMLNHYNVQSNVQQLGQVVALNGSDRFAGVLPFFHSFGFTATLMLPAVLGVGVVFHSNPLDARAIGTLIREHSITFLLATPTFLQLYLRSCESADLGGLRFVLAAGEKLHERVANSFEEKFGVRPVEAYGCTECSPALTVSTNDFRAAGFRQVGAKRGTIGHPLPGVSVRIIHPETHQPLAPGEPGLLLVRGPNVFEGYLNQPEKTAASFIEGCYCTGDIAAMDEDGFLQITDRLSRFSKIGGEMVPHVKVEEKLHELCGIVQQTFAVAGVPDAKKGERLIVLHTYPDPLDECLSKLATSGLPNLWIPRANQFFRVETLPLLGTGKLDLRQIKETAARLSPLE